MLSESLKYFNPFLSNVPPLTPIQSTPRSFPYSKSTFSIPSSPSSHLDYLTVRSFRPGLHFNLVRLSSLPARMAPTGGGGVAEVESVGGSQFYVSGCPSQISRQKIGRCSFMEGS
ncbi:hypothetical protein FRC03_000710 [Tulasnella sp. 419]|nr:hypothetical protein FRC03_000710 [Tulasnella sp. 419]